jgi:uncharacterized protein (TIGR02301 family)
VITLGLPVAIRRPSQRTGTAAAAATGVLALAILLSIAPAAKAQDRRPYDDRLLRLGEILGAVHYLRELCGANDGQLWRDKMQELMTFEGSSALRSMRLSRSFNQGYRNYSRTYVQCTPSAETAITKFLTEGAQIAETLVKTVP